VSQRAPSGCDLRLDGQHSSPRCATARASGSGAVSVTGERTPPTHPPSPERERHDVRSCRAFTWQAGRYKSRQAPTAVGLPSIGRIEIVRHNRIVLCAR